MESLSRREEQILLAIAQLGEEAYLVAIMKLLSVVMGRKWSIGAIHIPLRRLERSKFVEARFGDATAVRGGRRKKYYRLTELGMAALEENKRVNDLLWADFSRLLVK
jgi:PadR family transcriptional regulator PadR